jgi:uncharacterized protein (DUF488 family)
MPGGRLLTVGYEGRTPDELIRELKAHQVTVLVDVRLTPLSRKPGLSKTRLTEALRRRGIRYVHLRALGNPPENRVGLRAGSKSSQRRFQTLLKTKVGIEAMQLVADLMNDETVALLCFEREHATCHRRLVAEEIQRERPSLQVVTL